MNKLNLASLKITPVSQKIQPMTRPIAPDDYVGLVLEENLIWPIETYPSYVDDSLYQIVKMKTHLKTHTEAPIHLNGKGKSLDKFPLDQFVGRAVFFTFDTKGEKRITLDMVKAQDNGRLRAGDIIVCRALWQKGDDAPKPEMDPDIGPWLLEKGIKLFGQDVSFELGGANHDFLLSNDMPLLEMLVNLDKIEQDVALLIAIPGLIEIIGIDSSTTPAIVVEGIEFE